MKASASSAVTIPVAHQRLNTACPYFTMFPLDFPLQRLAAAKKGQWVLDPFCGRGTTMFAARLRGLNSVGIDASPVAAAIAAAKVARADTGEVSALARELLRSGYEPRHVPQGEFWEWAFHPVTLADICSLREQLAALPADDDAVAVLRAIVLGILHGPLTKSVPTYLSNQMPRTYATKPAAAIRFWEKRAMRPPHVDAQKAVLRRIEYTLQDVPRERDGVVYCGDSAEVLKKVRRQFDWVITSPPYYRMYTYLPDQWLRAWFVGGPPHVEYATDNQLRHSSVDVFTSDLAKVFARSAARCHPGARLAVRFGALPSIDTELSPEALLRSSLAQSGRWKVTRVRDSGQPSSRGRQALHMGGAGAYAEEVDLLAVLK